jgi:peroxiredoxin
MLSLMVGIIALVAAPGPTDDSARTQYEALVNEYDTAYKAAIDAVTKAKTDQERTQASLQRPQPHEFAPRFFALAEKYPDDSAAIDALTWIASKCLFGPHSERALGILARDYRRSERLRTYCSENSRYGEPFWPYEELLRAILKDTPHREVRARACVALAVYLKMAKEKTESHLIGDSRVLSRPPESLANFDRVRDRGLAKVAAESGALFEEVIERYSDVQLENSFPQNAGKFAKGQLFELRNLVIGAKAPQIEGRDVYGKALSLSDFRGKVVVLDFGSHRSCGVCRQMYPHLRQFVEDYKGKAVALLGISVDDDLKELRTISEKGETTWPIWWDGENMEGPLASQWVILSMPTFYVLDHKGVIRNKGFLQPDQIRETVNALLREMDSPRPGPVVDPLKAGAASKP